MIRFNFWANGRILAACEQLTLDAFTQAVTPDPGWGSLRGILVHTLDTEWGWRSNLQAQDASEIMKTADFADVTALKARWEVEKTAWFDYVDSLTDEQLQQDIGENPTASRKVWQVIMHVVAHSIQHRSEAALILTGYGHSPGELDFMVFLAEGS